MNSPRVSIRIPADLRREIEQEGRGVSEVIREALHEHLSKRRPKENSYEMALRLGIIGCAKKGPRDLSTNRRHFEGFGK
jgi:Arc/MetJ-type ribon-helix-helix transcriptional regulator